MRPREEALLSGIVGSLHGSGETAETLPPTCEGCGHCCGRMLIGDAQDVMRVKRYARRHHVSPTVPNMGGVTEYEQMCAWLDPKTKRCRVYPARPRICRCWASPNDEAVFGTRPGQPCGMSYRLAALSWVGHGELGDIDTWSMSWTAIREGEDGDACRVRAQG